MTPRRDISAKLCPEAGAALDALIDSGWELDRVPAEYREAARHLMEHFDHACDDAPDGASRLVEATIRRLLTQPASEATLSNASADALDMWSMSGYRLSAVPRSHREQAERHESIAETVAHFVEHTEADASEALIESTLERIADFVEIERPRSFGFTFRPRLSDIVSVAAVLLVGVSVTMPVLSSFRYESMRKQNESNFAVASVAFGSYASDHEGRLPVYSVTDALVAQSAGTARQWWLVGRDPSQSNSANLYTLSRMGYASLESLASPGNEHAKLTRDDRDAVDWDTFDEVSYSYRVIQGAEDDDRWARRGLIVLTDRSPVTVKAYQGLPIDPFENSPNHGGRGQHVLNGDGSVDWLTSPWLPHNDQIFLPRFMERLVNPGVRRTGMIPLRGVERPDSYKDAFVGP